MLTEEKLGEVYENLKPRKVKFAFERPQIGDPDDKWWSELDTIEHVFAAYAIDYRGWEWTDSNGVEHKGTTYIMPDYFTLEELWDVDYVNEFFPFSGCAEYIYPPELWKNAVKRNRCKR